MHCHLVARDGRRGLGRNALTCVKVTVRSCFELFESLSRGAVTAVVFEGTCVPPEPYADYFPLGRQHAQFF